MNKWIIDIIKEFIIKEHISTCPENIQALCKYFRQQGFDSVGLVCAALIADTKVLDILSIKH